MRGATRGRRKSSPRLLRRLIRPGLASLLLGSCLLLAAAFVAVAVQGNSFARESTSTRAEIALLQAELAAKQVAIGVMQNDDYVQQRARDLGYVRPGEALIAVQQERATAPLAVVDGRSTSRLSRWIALFFH
jgi:cell division protein FtsB